jgi:hypothetical protein
MPSDTAFLLKVRKLFCSGTEKFPKTLAEPKAFCKKLTGRVTLNQDTTVNLSELQDFNFSPDWKTHHRPPQGEQDRGRGPRNERGFRNNNGPRPFIRRDRQESFARRPQFPQQKPWEVLTKHFTIAFYPEDKPLSSLLKVIKSSSKTYELFNIAKLILEKPERFFLSIKVKPTSDRVLFLSTTDGIPFESEEAAKAHVFDVNFDHYFTIQEKDVEPPKGNFLAINQCGITGALLGPSNYHRYQQILKDHYASNITSASYETFLSRIVPVKTQEAIDSWVAQATKETVYLLKDPKDSKITQFSNLDSARQFFMSTYKEQLIHVVKMVRLAGSSIEILPQSLLKAFILGNLEHQRRFPLDTANYLRSFLRRANVIIYKKGNKGISFVSMIRRKFRDEQTVLSEEISAIITFIEKHPFMPIGEFPQKYLLEHAFTEAINSDDVASESTSEPTLSASLQPEGKMADTADFKQLLITLHWLIREGYVTEYEDGTLFAPPPMIRKQKDNSSGEECGGEDVADGEQNCADTSCEANSTAVEAETPVETQG